MGTIAGEIQWGTQENDDGSIGLMATIGFKAGMIIPVGLVGDSEKEEFAKRRIINRLFKEMYGDLDDQLRDLEMAISHSTPPYYTGDDAIMRCRKIQRDIYRQFYGPHPAELLGIRR